jgi:DNA primase
LRLQAAGISDEGVRRHYLDALRDRFDRLRAQEGGFQPSGGRRQSSLGRQGGRLSPSGRRMRDWEIQLPASRQLKSAAGQASPADAAERRARLIVLSFVNHPGLLHEFWDDFAALELTSHELDSLRTRILDTAASEEGLEPAILKTHLTERGFGPVLDRLEDQAKRLNEWFLGPSAAADDARTGLRQMIALHHKTLTLGRELRAAEAAFAREPNEDNLRALIGVREQLLSAQGSEATVAGFGTLSGRESSDPV